MEPVATLGTTFTRLEVDERRAQLLAVAYRLFGQRPYEEVSVEDIAAASGVSRGLLYHYFPGKRALYVAIVREGVAQLLEVMQPPAGLTLERQLRAVLNGYVEHILSQRHPYPMVLQAGPRSDPEVWAIVDGARATLAARILDSLPSSARHRPAGALAVRGWIGYVESVCLRWLDEQDLPRPELVELLARPLAPILAQALALP